MSRGAPRWTIRPSRSSTMLSDIDIASTWSWVTKIVVIPSEVTSARISTRMVSRNFASRLLSGSSSSSSPGSWTKARARATRCCCPAAEHG